MRGALIKILNKICEIIDTYNMFPEKVAYVAFSGGKDSTFLCSMLKELGYQVVGVTVDIGYGLKWADLRHNAEQLGIECLILDSASLEKDDPLVYQEILDCFGCVKRVAENPFGMETICTPCYNSKMLVLKHWAKMNGIPQIAFAHHGTDSIASLLKSYFFYHDYTYFKHLNYAYSEFYKVVEAESAKLTDHSDTVKWSEFIDRLYGLSQERVIGTDEPPRKWIEGSSIEIVRPMFNIFEEDIRKYYHEQSIIFEKSECAAAGYRDMNIYTPREMMHHFLTDRLSRERLGDLLRVVEAGLDQNGFLLFNVRNNRNQILGEYKSSASTKIKL